MTSKECVILGCGTTQVECDYSHGDIFGVNGTYTFSKKLDKLFFTDEESEVNSAFYDVPKIMSLEKLVCVFPIRYKRFNDLGLNIEIFPLEAIQKRFPTDLFSNTIAYMLAYALYHDYEKIWMYGIDMMTNTSYIQEKGGVEFWMGVAMGMSVERVRNGKSPIEIFNTVGSATGKTWNGLMYGHYGEQQLKELKQQEKLLVPFELARTTKSGKGEWTLRGDGEYHKCEPNVRGEFDIKEGVMK